MKTCITFHPHELALCPGPVTVLRPVNSVDEYMIEGTISVECPYGRVGDVLAVRESVTMPAALARWQFTVEGVDAERAEKHNPPDVPDEQFERDWDRCYSRYPWASNPLLWVMRGNVVEVKP